MPRKTTITPNDAAMWDPASSPQIELVRQGYKLQYNLNGFTNKRVRRLAQAMGITVESVCALAGVFGKNKISALFRQAERRESELRAMKERRAKALNNMPRTTKLPETWFWPWPIALHFAKLERFHFEQKLLSPVSPGPDEIGFALMETQT